MKLFKKKEKQSIGKMQVPIQVTAQPANTINVQVNMSKINKALQEKFNAQVDEIVERIANAKG